MGVLADALVQKGGYNPTDAANAEKGPRAAELAREFLGSSSGGGSSYSSSSSYNPADFQQAVQQAQQMLTQAKQPAIASLEASRPEIQAGYAQQRTSLQNQQQLMEQRYQNLLADIAGREKTQTEKATKVTAGELGARGIAPGSTFYEQNILGATQPIASEYAGLTRDVGLSQAEEAANLANLSGQLTTSEASQLRELANAIAGIQSATGESAISTALQQYQMAQQAREADLQQQQFKAQQEQQGWENQWQEKMYEYELNKPYYAPTGGGGDMTWLSSLLGLSSGLGQSSAPTEAKPSSTPSRQGVSYTSPGGQWAWDWSTKDWYPVVD